MATTKTHIEPKPLEIRLLGELVVLRDGRTSPLPASKKTRALLAYLVATGRSHSRERLCELLWEVPDDPRGALRWSLSKLRPILDTPARARIAADRERVAFDVDGAEVDLLGIRALSARGLAGAALPELSAAASRFGGPFLEGLDLPDCVQFYGWCVAEREQARALHVSVLKTLIARTRSSPEQALAHARALVALDPLAESSHLEVIRLLAAAGRTGDALDECDRCSRTMEELIGASPSAELGRLRVSLRPSHGGDRSADRARAVPAWTRPVAPGVRTTVLVGRAREQQVLDRLVLPGTVELKERGLLLVGDSGMGKTRLLEELASRTLAAGGRVLSGRAFEAEGVRPYGVWIEALRTVPREAVADHLRTDLALLLPELGAAALNADRPRLFDAILELLRALSASAPRLAVLLDDIQWMDEASAALLHYLARATEGESIVFACAARPGELEDNAPALAVVRALEREHRLARLLLAPLAADETAALARQVAPGVDGQRVHSESEGNPLFALELARALSREEVDTSATLGHLVRDRLGALGEPEQAVLAWASALGRSFESSALARVSGLSPAVLLDGLERLERHGVLRASSGGSYDFSHDVVRSAAYARMSEPRRRLVHIQIARTVWQDCGDGEAAGEVLHHAALAGEQELAARASVAAGERCIRLFAYGDALDLSRRGLEHAARLPARVRLPLEVELLGLRARRPSGGALGETDGALAEAARAAERAGLPEVAARAEYFRSLVLYGGGDLAGALASSERRVERARSAGNTTADLHLLGSARCLAMLERDMGVVFRVLEDARQSLVPGPGALDFHWTRGLLRQFLGEYPLAIADLERTALQTSGEDQHWECCWCTSSLAVVSLEHGDPVAAVHWAGKLEAVAGRVGDGVEGPAAAAIQALVRTTGDPRAWTALEQSLADVRAADGKAMLSVLSNFAAEWALTQGRTDQARGLAEEALAAATAVSRTSQAMVARAVLGRLALARGDSREVAAQLSELTSALAQGAWTVSARARATAERFRNDMTAQRFRKTQPQPRAR